MFSPLLSQLGGDTGVVNPQLARMKSVMRVMSVLMIGITYKMPAVSST